MSGAAEIRNFTWDDFDAVLDRRGLNLPDRHSGRDVAGLQPDALSRRVTSLAAKGSALRRSKGQAVTGRLDFVAESYGCLAKCTVVWSGWHAGM
ncbi:MAG: hypothetical protein QF554_02655 [Dehalococcoidia bacterium]|nr:hypothetical protein [Dehalococcoidia bacterium]